jgi:hypothetical protein
MPVSRPVRTGCYAIAASYAQVFINMDNSGFLVLEGGAAGTGIHAGWFIALHASPGLKMNKGVFAHAEIRLSMLDPVSPAPPGNIMLHLARYHACLAVNAHRRVNDHAVFFLHQATFLTVTRVSCMAMFPDISS